MEFCRSPARVGRRCDDVGQHGGELLSAGIAREKKHRRIVLGHFRRPADVGGHDRHARGQRFQMGQAQSFIGANRYQGVARRQQRRHVVYRANSVNPLDKTAFCDRRLKGRLTNGGRFVDSRSLAGDDELQPASNAASGQFLLRSREDRRQQLQPLLRARIGQREEHEIIAENPELPPQSPACFVQLGGPLKRCEVDAVPDGSHGDGNRGLAYLGLHRLRARHQERGIPGLQSRQILRPSAGHVVNGQYDRQTERGE